MTYEGLKSYFIKNSATGELSLLATIFAGGMAGIFNWSVGMPADLLKIRLQTGKYYK